jgi:hypothetical protein
MIGRRVQFEQAYSETKQNKHRIYTAVGNNGKSGFERTRQADFPAIFHRPKFKLDQNSQVFTIGSCFARNIESSLAARGIGCVTTKCIIPGELYELEGLGARNGALNAYTPYSMLELVRRADSRPEPTFGALQVDDDGWIDMLVSGLNVLTKDQLEDVRGKLFDTYFQLKSCGVVIVTLGYTESWFDRLDKIYVNRSPGSSRKAMRHGDRYEFHNASATQVEAVLREIVDNVERLTHGAAKIIFTVSPVPLHATFSNRDSVSANLYSKSTLLSAAMAVSEENDSVDYFPSYELVIYSNPDLTWANDGVHVKPAAVDRVIEKFHSLYY